MKRTKSDQGWLYTGDIGYLDEGGVLFLVGRKREMIMDGGFQVWPPEPEDILCKHPKIKDVAVVGVADKRMGDIPKAFLVLKEKTFSASQEEDLEKEIIEYCRDDIAHFKAIRSVRFIDQIPLSDTGKGLKPKLIEMYQEEQR